MSDKFTIIRKSYGGDYIAFLENKAEEIIIITPDLFWDLKGGFADVVVSGLKKGKNYTYIMYYEEQQKAQRFLKILQRNKPYKGLLKIYLVPYPILFEVAIYKFSYKAPVYLLVADRDDIECNAIDVNLTSQDYKNYIDNFVNLSLKNYVKVFSI